MKLSQFNADLEKGELKEIPPELFYRWLWKTDLQAPLKPRFNENHLLGLFLARCKAQTGDTCLLRISDISPGIMHCNRIVKELTFRQWKYVVEDVQMHWHEYFSFEKLEDLVDALFVKFGLFNVCECYIDDLSAINPERPRRLSDATLRRYLSLFCVMFRHIDLDARSEDLIADSGCHYDIQSYHVQASLDNFYEHAMLTDIPIGSRIQYKQDFSGMYHSISQVVYFHYPNYARKKQISLEDIKRGHKSIYCLSVAMQLQPDVTCMYEDEALPDQWCWVMLTGGTVYLRSPTDQIFTSSSMWSLVACAVGDHRTSSV